MDGGRGRGGRGGGGEVGDVYGGITERGVGGNNHVLVLTVQLVTETRCIDNAKLQKYTILIQF